jgi:hypothetical protein
MLPVRPRSTGSHQAGCSQWRRPRALSESPSSRSWNHRFPSGDSAGEEELVQTAEMIRHSRRGDAVASFLAGVGLPPEVIDGMKKSPEWRGLEAMAHTLLYDGAITEDDKQWNERARRVSV